MELLCVIQVRGCSTIKRILSLIIMLTVLTNMVGISYANPTDLFTPYRQSQHFSFNIPTDKFAEEITPQQLGRYLLQMDKLYAAMADVFEQAGFLPDDGSKIQINYDSDLDPQKNYAHATRGGSVITLSWYATDNMVEEISKGNVYWIVAHELGHCFGVAPTFNTEFTADFLTLYASVAAGVPLVDWHERTGGIDADIDKWYQNEYNWQLDTQLNPSQPLHDTRYSSILTCAIINYMRNPDSDPSAIKKTFASYHTQFPQLQQINYAGSDRAVKFNDFIDRLDYFTQTDFRRDYLTYDNWLRYLKREFPTVVYNGEKLRVGDAMEIFKYLARMDSVYDSINLKPNITDAMEVLKYLSRIDSVYG